MLSTSHWSTRKSDGTLSVMAVADLHFVVGADWYFGLEKGRPTHYSLGMSVSKTSNGPFAPVVIATLVVIVGLLGVVAYGGFGTDMFVTLVETGLSWCF